MCNCEKLELPPTPECQKLSDKGKEWDSINQFFEWLQEKRLVLCFLDDFTENYYPHYQTIKDLLYEYLDIDKEKLEQERRALLDYMRELNRKALKTK